MNLRGKKVDGGILRKIERRHSITDPEGIALVLGAAAVMSAVVWLKARGLPAKRPRDVVPRPA